MPRLEACSSCSHCRWTCFPSQFPAASSRCRLSEHVTLTAERLSRSLNDCKGWAGWKAPDEREATKECRLIAPLGLTWFVFDGRASRTVARLMTSGFNRAVPANSIRRRVVQQQQRELHDFVIPCHGLQPSLRVYFANPRLSLMSLSSNKACPAGCTMRAPNSRAVGLVPLAGANASHQCRVPTENCILAELTGCVAQNSMPKLSEQARQYLPMNSLSPELPSNLKSLSGSLVGQILRVLVKALPACSVLGAKLKASTACCQAPAIWES